MPDESTSTHSAATDATPVTSDNSVSAYNAATRALPKTNVACPADTHRTVPAALHGGCICAEGLEKLDARRAKDRETTRARRARAREGHNPIGVHAQPVPPPEPARTWPDVKPYGNAGRTVVRSTRPACRDADPDLFFPPEGADPTAPAVAPQIAQAKAWCRRCPVVTACLLHALDAAPSGIWGGTTEDERRNIRRHGAVAVGRRA